MKALGVGHRRRSGCARSRSSSLATVGSTFDHVLSGRARACSSKPNSGSRHFLVSLTHTGALAGAIVLAV